VSAFYFERILMNNLLHYSPIIIAVIIFLIQQRIVVTPEQLERKHREILKDAEERFATLSSVCDLKEQFSDMKEKIDKIYDCIISVKKG
jgi:hypothetical protein